VGIEGSGLVWSGLVSLVVELKSTNFQSSTVTGLKTDSSRDSILQRFFPFFYLIKTLLESISLSASWEGR
jgi:hypothetical protein